MKKFIMLFIIAILLILSGCTPKSVENSQDIEENNSNLLPTENQIQTQSSHENISIETEPPTSTLPKEVGSKSIGDTYYSSLGNGGYDVQKYTIILDVDMNTGEVKAVTHIEARTTQDLSTFSLDFTGMTLDEVRVNEEESEFSRKIRKLVITPKTTLSTDTSFNVEIQYHGIPQTVSSFVGDFSVGWYRMSDGTINVYTEPDGAYAWFPCNNHPRDKALYRFEITVDDPWIAAANGSLIDTISNENKTTYIFEMNEPMATYLATVDIDHYDVETMPGPDGILIRNYFPTDFPDSQRENYQVIPEVMDYYNNVFGPYPSTEYGVLVMDEDATSCISDPFGDETQSLTIVCPDPSSTGIHTIVHELAHEWFGDSVSLENWQDLWLKEGMATYAWCLWDTRDEDTAALHSCMVERAGDYEGRYPVDQPPHNNLFCDEAYTGGSLVYYSLHQKVGDEMFFKILRTYLDRYRGSYAGTDEFIAVVNEVTGQDLEDTIREWLKDPVIPK